MWTVGEHIYRTVTERWTKQCKYKTQPNIVCGVIRKVEFFRRLFPGDCLQRSILWRSNHHLCSYQHTGSASFIKSTNRSLQEHLGNLKTIGWGKVQINSPLVIKNHSLGRGHSKSKVSRGMGVKVSECWKRFLSCAEFDNESLGKKKPHKHSYTT